jgi:apolipoprotein N-acyltransferase
MIALGLGQGIYHKHHLLPFGDFLPFNDALRGLIHFFDIPLSDFSAGKSIQAALRHPLLEIKPFICYEIAFPEQVRKTLGTRNQLIVTLSEDGWFGHSWGPHQHLDIARMRALETGRWVLRATPTGISAIINPHGDIVARAPQFVATTLSGVVWGTTGQTPWQHWGLWPLCAMIGIFSILIQWVRKFYDQKTVQYFPTGQRNRGSYD